MRFAQTMIARHFSAICLLAAGVGFFGTTLVQSVPARSRDAGQVKPCVFEVGLVCKMAKSAS